MTETSVLKVAPPLPATRDDLIAAYKLKRRRTINDMVEEIILKLWESDDNFMKYVDAIYNEESVEGSMEDDDVMAAIIIRDFAVKDKRPEVASRNIRTIKLAMRVALKRFDQGRSQRFDKAELPPPATPTQQADQADASAA